MYAPLRILTINVRGLGTARKRDLLLHELNENLDYDFFLLQEKHISCKTQADLIERSFNGQCFWSFGIGKSAGVAIFVSPKFSGKIIRLTAVCGEELCVTTLKTVV